MSPPGLALGPMAMLGPPPFPRLVVQHPVRAHQFWRGERERVPPVTLRHTHTVLVLLLTMEQATKVRAPDSAHARTTSECTCTCSTCLWDQLPSDNCLSTNQLHCFVQVCLLLCFCACATPTITARKLTFSQNSPNFLVISPKSASLKLKNNYILDERIRNAIRTAPALHLH